MTHWRYSTAIWAMFRIACAVLAVTAGLARASTGVAFITDVSGEHKVEGKRAALMAELSPGQVISVGARGAVVVMYIQSGHEFQLTQGEFKVKADALEPVKSKTGTTGKATRRSTLWRPDVGSMVNVSRTATASLRMRGVPPTVTDATKLRLLDPVDTVVTSLRPTLAWHSAPGTKASVRLELDGKLIEQDAAATMRWAPTQRLEAGKRYRWVVSDGTSERDAMFTVLDPAGQKQLAALPATKSFSDRLLRAIALHSLGASSEARAAFAELSAERPDLPELANLGR